MATSAARSVDKALELLALAIEDSGATALAGLAERAQLPLSTAHRFALGLRRRGFLTRLPNGRYLAGPALLRLRERVSHGQVLATLSRPVLRDLARRCHQTAHLGILENDMVTYLVKETASPESIFTREGMQLEAYCSGIGRVLLANLPADEREQYLSEGPFVALTSRTIVDVPALRIVLDQVRAEGHAIDFAEVSDNLGCLAVPIASRDGIVRAAISVSTRLADFTRIRRATTLAALSAAAECIGARAYGS